MQIDDNESKMDLLKRELEGALARINSLEKENQELEHELVRLRAQVSALKAHDNDRKSILWKKLQNSMDIYIAEKYQQKSSVQIETPERSPPLEKYQTEDLVESTVKKERSTRVQKALPRSNHYLFKEVRSDKEQPAESLPPPPPPPLPSKLLIGSKAVRRVPQVVEFYRLLMKRDAQRENSNNPIRVLPITNPVNMIGEIENRSTYLLQIKSDVETHGEIINFLTREVETATFTEIEEVEAFVQWLDGELSCLVDERAVLKHFQQWPERKADAMREATCSYRDLKNLEYEVSSFKDNPKQLLIQSLRRMQALQDRLERDVNNIERVREGTSKRYREFHIPWKWMLDTRLIGQLKLSSLTLAKEYMERIGKELQSSASSQEESLLLQGVRFAYRVHQFAGGFDADTMQAFEELRKIGTRSYK